MEALAARVQRLEDIEEIKQLKAAYCRFCDDGYDPDGIASLFTDDGIWAGGDTFVKRTTYVCNTYCGDAHMSHALY